jgi:cytochrome c
MKRFVMTIAAVAGMGAVAPVVADEVMAKAKNCMACHAVDKKLVGPSYKDVAAKYGKDGGAVDKLAAKIQKGGSGAWGAVPMPPNANVNPDEAKALATWIMSFK